MKRNTLTIALLIAVALLLCETSGAQVQKRGYTEAVIGTDINDILPDDMIFMYPEFLKGSVHFLDRSVAEGVMNIYLPGLQLYFIDSNKDTLVMRNQDEARLLTIGHDTYLRHDKTWVRILATSGTAAFCLKSVLKIHQDVKIGAYGTTDVTSSITNVNMMYGVEGNTAIRLKSLRHIPYTLTHFGLLYDGSKLYIANVRNFKRMFPDRKDDIEKYIAENKLNLDDAKAALQLFNFLNL